MKVWYLTSFIYVTSASIFNLVTYLLFYFYNVQGDFLEVLEVAAYDERLTQIDRDTIL
jgi:hypothetical protein